MLMLTKVFSGPQKPDFQKEHALFLAIEYYQKKKTFAIQMWQTPALPLRKPWSYHARMDSCLFNVSCNAGNKCISVFKISVEIWLEGKRKPSHGGQHHRSCVLQLRSTHLVEQ